MPYLQNNNECIWLKIEDQDSKFLVAYYYRNPGQSVAEFDLFLNGLNNSIIDAKSFKLPIFILGDFNAHNKKWEPCITQNDHKGQQLQSLMEAFCFNQLISQKTYFSSKSSSLIDLIFTDCVASVNFVEVGDQICEKHCPIICSLVSSIAPIKQSFKRTIYDYKACQIDNLCNFLRDRLSARDINSMSLDDCTNFITSTLLTARDEFVPFKTITTSKKDEPWITEQIKIRKKQCNKLFKIHRK